MNNEREMLPVLRRSWLSSTHGCIHGAISGKIGCVLRAALFPRA